MGLWRHRFYDEHRSAVLTIIMISQFNWNAFSSNKKNSNFFFTILLGGGLELDQSCFHITGQFRQINPVCVWREIQSVFAKKSTLSFAEKSSFGRRIQVVLAEKSPASTWSSWPVTQLVGSPLPSRAHMLLASSTNPHNHHLLNQPLRWKSAWGNVISLFVFPPISWNFVSIDISWTIQCNEIFCEWSVQCNAICQTYRVFFLTGPPPPKKKKKKKF